MVFHPKINNNGTYSIIYSNIMNHIDNFNILTDRQHDFCRNRSCESQLLLMMTHDFAHALDKRRQTDVIIMDFSKAFNVVPHIRLLNKIDFYGIRCLTYHWISNFLMHRQQRVVMGGKYSNWARVKSGVPQGTIFGSLAFPFVQSHRMSDYLLTTV